MRKKIFTFLLALAASVGMGWATDPIVIATNTGQSSYTQGTITVSVGNVGDSDGFRLNDDNPASISNSGSSTISKIELVPGWFLNKHSYVRANGAEPNSSSEELITFLNVNSNEVTLSCSVSIYIKEVRIYFEEPEPAPAGNVKLVEFQVPASWENDNTPVSSADFPDFVATTYEIASALPVTSEPSLVVFDFPGDDEVSVYSKMGGQVSQPSTGAIKREAFFENTQVHYYYPVLDGDEPEPQIGPKEVLDLGTTGCVGEHYQLTGGGTNIYRTVGGVDDKMITIESLHGEIIDNISLKLYYYNVWTGYSVAASAGDVSSWNYDAYEDLVITNINATSVTLSRVGSGQANGYVMFEKVTINNSDEPAPTNPVIKLNANFGGTNDWADTEAFTDNGDGTASWSISTLTAGSWYNFGVKVDDTWVSDHAAFDRENPSRVVSGTGEAMWFQADVAGEYTFTWEYATNTLTIGYPEIHTYTAVGQNLGVFGNSWDPSITDNDLVLQEDGSYKWEKEKVAFTGAITIQYRVCEDHAWNVAYPATSEQPASFEIPSLGDYKITITYNPVGNVISASAEKIAKPTIQLNGNFSGEWADTEAFEVSELPLHSYAKLTKLLEPGTYEFGVKVNGEWRANGSAYTRDNYEYIIEEGHTSNLTINVDVKGYYSFFWYYDDDRLSIDYSRVCGMYWKDVTAGNFEVTLGQEGEVTLPKVWATSSAFVANIAKGSDQVRLGSTDETVATIAYTLSMDGLGTLTFHQAGECDIYVVHDITNSYCYDSCAFHLTVLPAPAPQPADVNITPNVDPQNAGVYYSTFYDSANKYALPANVEAYVATRDGANLLLSKIADAGQTIPADNAVILKSSVTPFTLSISDAEAVTFTATNDLQGTDESINTPANCYVLAGNDGVGFYHYTASMLNPHKAYVIYSGSQAPHRMPFIFEQATGVENVQGDNVQSTKDIENGVLYIIKNGVKYNAMGQPVNQ